MPDSTASKIEFAPRPLGITLILITALAFSLGLARNELALSLLGSVFLIVIIYCLLGVLLLGIIHRSKARQLSMVIVPEVLNAGDEGEFFFKSSGDASGSPSRGKKFFSLPAIIIRCELRLGTMDGRIIRHLADPGAGDQGCFPVPERGAYNSGPEAPLCDRFAIFDAPGFFRLTIPLGQGPNPRLLALPGPAEENLSFSLKSGGGEAAGERHYQKSDSLTDHRPYVPGDDPRRINWKLYSHTPMGDLFVREGEPRPPPHSQLTILIDGETDPSLFSPEEGRRAVDILCENALAAALEFSARGIDIQWGGGADISAALARPYSIRPDKTLQAELAPVPADRAVLILALPRLMGAGPLETRTPKGVAPGTRSSLPAPSALDRFLSSREAGFAQGGTDIVFIFDRAAEGAPELAEAAGLCVSLYNNYGRNIHAASI